MNLGFKYNFFLRLLLAVIIFFQTNNLAFAGSEYKIGPGDEICIYIRIRGYINDFTKLSPQSPIVVIGDYIYFQHMVTVGPDGFISLPLLQQLKVAGFTLEQIKDIVAQELKFPLTESPVSVSLIHPNNSAFYVSGEVKQPGRFILDKNITFMEAVAAAGGLTEKARSKTIKLFRGNETIKFDLSYNIIDNTAKSNFSIKSGDIIFVPRKRTPDTLTVMLVLSIISTVTGIYIAAK